MNIITKIKAAYQRHQRKVHFRDCCKEAEAKHKATGRRYYVIPFGEGKLKVVDNKFVNTWNKFQKQFGVPPINIDYLLKNCLYMTKQNDLNGKPSNR